MSKMPLFLLLFYYRIFTVYKLRELYTVTDKPLNCIYNEFMFFMIYVLSLPSYHSTLFLSVFKSTQWPGMVGEFLQS